MKTQKEFLKPVQNLKSYKMKRVVAQENGSELQ